MIIVLHPYKFSNYFISKLGFNEIKKKLKLQVEYHDLSKIINPNIHKYFTQKRDFKVLEFNSIDNWKRHLEKKKNKKNIYIFNLLNNESFKSIYIHYVLSKFNFTIIQYRSSEIFYKKNNNFFINFEKFLNLVCSGQKAFFFSLKNFIFIKIINLIKFKKLLILYAGKKKRILHHLNARKTLFIKYNTSDYFNYLNFKKKKNKILNTKTIVYLDSNAPYFTDKMIFGYKIKYNIEQWYKTLNFFLKNVENIFKKKVVIVLHPRSRHIHNQLYDKSFKVLRGKYSTINSIKNSYIVLANSATTAVSYCVIYEKPINFIYNSQLKNKSPKSLIEIRSLAENLKTKVINQEKHINKNDFNIKVNKYVYKKYKYNFLTSEETEKKNILQIWRNILKSNNYEKK